MDFEKLKSTLFSTFVKMNVIMLIMFGFSIGVLYELTNYEQKKLISIVLTCLIGFPLFAMSLWFLGKHIPLMR